MATPSHPTSLIPLLPLLLLLFAAACVDAHGAVEAINRGARDGSTGSRNWQAHKLKHGALREWDPYSLNGVGGRTDQFDLACGEPGQTSHGTQYAGVGRSAAGISWLTAGTHAAGGEIGFTVKVTANHGGIMEMRYACADGRASISNLDFYDRVAEATTPEACFALNGESNVWREGSGCHAPRVLRRTATSGKTFAASRPEWYIVSQDSRCFENQLGAADEALFDLRYRLPAELAGCHHAIVQWWWQTSNNCVFPAWRSMRAAGTWPCDSATWPNWGLPTCDAAAGTKAASGEQFVNCIDLQISGAPSPTPPDEPTSSPTPDEPTPTPTPTPAVTYNWGETTAWVPAACPTACGLDASERTRTVACAGSDGSTADDALCTGEGKPAKPATSLPCAATEACSTPTPTPVTPTPTPSGGACGGEWASCLESRCCDAGLACYRQHEWYAQCRPSCPTDGSWDCTVLSNAADGGNGDDDDGTGATPTPTPTPSPTPDEPTPTPTPTPAVTYNWGETTAWVPAACPTACGLDASERTRTVACAGSDGSTADDALCTGEGKPAKPATSLPCAATEACSTPTPVTPVTPTPTPAPTPAAPTPTPTTGSFFATTAAGSSETRRREFVAALTTLVTVPIGGEPAAVRAVHSSGGAAGGVVSEGQGYGLLVGGLALAGMGADDAAWETAVQETYETYLGWRRMCELSAASGSCQSPFYCGAECPAEGGAGGAACYPCLPHWKFDDALSAAAGTGAAPDGDEDAIVGMMLLVLATEPHRARYAWWDEVARVTYQSAKQFWHSDTVAGTGADAGERLVKLGSCWGGFDCQNPSYHAPGAMRAMRDYMRAYDERVGMPAGEGDGYAAGWNAAVASTYKLLSDNQCASDGLTTNWFVPASPLGLGGGALTCSGSGTPAAEFGSEASRGVWRVAMDALWYGDETAAAGGPELSAFGPGHYLDRVGAQVASRHRSGAGCPACWEDTLVDAFDADCFVASVHASWNWNAFISGPVFASLVHAVPSLGAEAQQAAIDAAGQTIASFAISDYYAGSWVAISTATLNGDLHSARALLDTIRGEGGVGSSSTDQPQPTPTPAPAPADGGDTAAAAVDCAVTAWSGWGECSAACGGGTQSRTRTVAVAASGGGAVCPALTETRACNLEACSTPTPVTPTPTPSGGACGGEWASCLESRCCDAGLACYRQHEWYAQCRPSCPTDGSWDCTVLSNADGGAAASGRRLRGSKRHH